MAGMSEGHDLSTEFTEVVVKYLSDRIIELRARGWAEADIAEIETNLERIGHGSLDSFHLTPERLGKERQLLIETPTEKGIKRALATINRYMSSLSASLSYACR